MKITATPFKKIAGCIFSVFFIFLCNAPQNASGINYVYIVNNSTNDISILDADDNLTDILNSPFSTM